MEKVLAKLPAVLVDHAHLERKAATSALNWSALWVTHWSPRSDRPATPRRINGPNTGTFSATR